MKTTAKETRAALIVAHGQPSDPDPAEAEIVALAAHVGALLPDWQVHGATLAAPGALASALAALGPEPVLVYPLFMADGWFTATHLPARISAAGSAAARFLPPFGLAPEVQDLVVTLVREALASSPAETTRDGLLLAAHGSFRSEAPARVAHAMADRITAETGLPVRTGFIDQSPRISEVASGMSADALCLPFFAASGGHVTDDLPAALALGGFAGRLLNAVGTDGRVPGLIARALRDAH